MRRTSSSVLRDLEIRVAKLEKQLPLESPFLQTTFISDPRKMEVLWKKAFKKNLRSFLIKLEEIVEDEIALENIGLGDSYLEEALARSEFYFTKGLEELISTLPAGRSFDKYDFFLGDSSLISRIEGRPMAHILHFAWVLIGAGVVARDNRQFISKKVKELLG